MRATASPSEISRGKLKEMVIAGSWPSWLMVSEPAVCSTRANVPMGTSLPEALRIRTSGRIAGVQLALSVNSIITLKVSPVL